MLDLFHRNGFCACIGGFAVFARFNCDCIRYSLTEVDGLLALLMQSARKAFSRSIPKNDQ